ncbi:hypothetical protein E3E36_10790 [Thermococcus sp. M36]|uniref:hypothetical protein n=1 Tax=Thermococcus sp. M36 TaxID=1638261 RepID=UPI00143900E0|nr:hypothetical protein [Thermococcus sp. M36]NJE06612.1 hypothetical protein [Thermococcus sp. M36]
MRTFTDLKEDMVELLKLFHMISRYKTLPEGARLLLEEAWTLVEDWRDWADEADRVMDKLDELARAEVEAHYEKYFSVVQEDENGCVWVPLGEIYTAVMRARREVKESAGIEE